MGLDFLNHSSHNANAKIELMSMAMDDRRAEQCAQLHANGIQLSGTNYVLLRATCDIRTGEEIVVKYGPGRTDLLRLHGIVG